MKTVNKNSQLIFIYPFTIFCFMFGIVFAEINTVTDGRIEGKVIDINTLEPLAGVNIVVSDTDRGASTDINGWYVIENLPIGSYRLEVSYIGYVTQKITDVIVMHNKPAMVNVQLSEQIIETEKIVVTAGYRRLLRRGNHDLLGVGAERALDGQVVKK